MPPSVLGRLLWLTCVAWAGALGLATPQAASGSAPDQAPGTPRPDLQLFVHSRDCVACHNQLSTPAGEDVSIGSSWRATMMANSARDPYWQAAVRRETLDHPGHADAIQDECAACHMPMAQRMARADGRHGAVFTHLPFPGDVANQEQYLAADGVSCTVCHQVDEQALGTSASFNGAFVLVAPTIDGIRRIVGPYAVDQGRRRIMRSVTGYEQVEAPHVGRSELCASCHTLITQAFGPDGSVIGRLPEQMNYQEWQHSAFAREERSCQSCHMPRTEGPMRIASVLGEARPHLARHRFIGGNSFMLQMLDRFRIALGVDAPSAELEATAAATRRQLASETADVEIVEAERSNAALRFEVRVRNRTGHKFPTGYPARRAWLHVAVEDALGRAVFTSGAPAPDGSIADNDADADGTRFEMHHEEITRPDQVQIYESILGDPAGRPTTGLLTATAYLKDNRLLPRGFDKATAAADIAVVGAAASDSDFVGEMDRVRYRVALPAEMGLLRVRVVLRYQPIAYRWARNLAAYDAPEPRRFVGYFGALADRASEVVATADTVVPAP